MKNFKKFRNFSGIFHPNSSQPSTFLCQVKIPKKVHSIITSPSHRFPPVQFSLPFHLIPNSPKVSSFKNFSCLCAHYPQCQFHFRPHRVQFRKKFFVPVSCSFYYVLLLLMMSRPHDYLHQVSRYRHEVKLFFFFSWYSHHSCTSSDRADN